MVLPMSRNTKRKSGEENQHDTTDFITKEEIKDENPRSEHFKGRGEQFASFLPPRLGDI
jgi:hypothetical protein